MQSISGTTIAGIALNPSNQSEYAEVDFFVGGEFVERTTANLAQSVIDGSSSAARCGFRHTLKLDFPAGSELEVSVRLRDGSELDNSPFRLRQEVAPQESGSIAAALPPPSGPEVKVLGTAVGWLPDDALSGTIDTIAVFGRFLRVDPRHILVGDRPVSPPADGDPFTSLQPSVCSSSSVSIEDIWFLHETGLRVRLGGPQTQTEQGPIKVQLYQVDLAAQTLVEGGSAIVTEGPALLDARLVSPLLPALIVELATNNTILGATILPFPSLCRGGLHHAELRVLGEGPNHMVSLRRVSAALLREHLQEAPADVRFSLAEVHIDMRGASGAERIFAPLVKDWLSGFLGLDLIPEGLESISVEKTRQYLEAALVSDRDATVEPSGRRAYRRPPGNLVLTIPADAIPTLSAVTSKRMTLPRGSDGQVGSFLIADSDSGNPGYSVSMPPMNSFLLPLQPAHAPICFPLLTPSGHIAEESDSILGHPPLAIRFHGGPIKDESQLLIPVASENAVLATSLSDADVQELTISALFAPSANGEAAVPFLRSLAAQSISARIEVVAVLPQLGDAASPLLDALSELFPGRHRILEHQGAPSARLNLAARQASGRYFFVGAETIVLHDRRTLETLCVLVHNETVASSSCMVVREIFSSKSSAITFYSGGLFPSHLSVASAPNLIFKELETTAALPLATYPVAGNSFRLALVRADAWQKLGGLDESAFPSSDHDLDFSLRATQAGYIHLVTSAISASDLATSPTEQIDVLALGYQRPQRWQEIFQSCTIIRDLR